MTTKTNPTRFSPRQVGVRRKQRKQPDAIQLAEEVKKGFPFARLSEFQRTSGLSWELLSQTIDTPLRTIARRQDQGRLRPDESDRLQRILTLFDMATRLFEGDSVDALRWLQTPQEVLQGLTPLNLATTEVGCREVENLIMRLEHGVFS